MVNVICAGCERTYRPERLGNGEDCCPRCGTDHYFPLEREKTSGWLISSYEAIYDHIRHMARTAVGEERRRHLLRARYIRHKYFLEAE